MAAKRRAKGRAPAILRLPNGWDPRLYQRDFWDYFEGGGKRGVAIACRRWGKDDVALHRTAVGAHERTATYWHLLPEYAQGRKAIWDAVNPHTGKRRIDEAFPEHLRSHTDERGMFMRFTCGSTWQVIGSDNFNSVVGSPPYGIVFSEWALSNPAAWAYLSPILEENGGWAMFITTPRGRNHGASFYERALKTPGWFALRQGVNDIGIFSPQQLANIKAELVDLYGEEDGENLFNQEYHVSFDAAILGSYYGKILAELDQQRRITSVPYDPTYPVYTSWDLGLDYPTMVWFVQLIGREVRWIDYYESRNRGLIDSARMILDKRYLYAEHYGPHDIDVREQTTAKTRKDTIEGVGLRPIRAGSQTGAAERIHALRNMLTMSVSTPRSARRAWKRCAIIIPNGTRKRRRHARRRNTTGQAMQPTRLARWRSSCYDVKAALNSRRQVVAGDYDVLRIGTPGYAEQLARGRPWDPPGIGLADDRPWMQQETAGMDWDPLKF